MSRSIERFEDLECWKSARDLVKFVFDCCKNGALAKDFETRSQLKRAALSAMNNIAEGFGRYGDKEFARFLDISQSSSVEVKSMSYAIEDAGYLDNDSVTLLRNKAEKTKALTLGLVRYIRNRSTN